MLPPGVTLVTSSAPAHTLEVNRFATDSENCVSTFWDVVENE